MSMWSALVAVLGASVTGALARRLGTAIPQRSPHVFWLLGLGAILPAWLVEFVLLLARNPETFPFLKRLVLAGIAVALLGVVVTDAVVRRHAAAGAPAAGPLAWLLGVAALAPGWLILLLARGWFAP
jgi:hypothetical protein